MATDSKTDALNFEDEDDFVDDDALLTIPNCSDEKCFDQKRCVTFEDIDDDDMSDPDGAHYWYADISYHVDDALMCYERSLDENRGSAPSFHREDDADEVPEIGVNRPNLLGYRQTTLHTVSSLTQENGEVDFFHFVFLVMLRHLFEL